jgi:hypothetical protein
MSQQLRSTAGQVGKNAPVVVPLFKDRPTTGTAVMTGVLLSEGNITSINLESDFNYNVITAVCSIG